LANENLNLGQFACFAVYSAEHAFHRVYKPLLDELGLTYPQFLVMVLLWEENRLTVSGICDRLYLEANTVTPLLKRLEAGGWVRRVRDQVDRRQVWAVLTEDGRQLEAKAADMPKSILKASGHSWDTLMRLTREIADLRDNLTRSAAQAEQD
jgi:DNA-binding MarR family transcriptional regulator